MSCPDRGVTHLFWELCLVRRILEAPPVLEVRFALNNVLVSDQATSDAAYRHVVLPPIPRSYDAQNHSTFS